MKIVLGAKPINMHVHHTMMAGTQYNSRVLVGNNMIN